ncbi:hypothetical protein EPO44_10165 [bacterium]|nr:MAG: hypothetical protein EPO44_10165 [bacterium]
MGQLLGPDAARAGVLGGGLYTVNRLIGDYVSPVQKYLSLTGIGDPMAAGTLRGIEGGYFPLPVPLTAGGLPIIPSEIRAAPAMIAAAATESMGRVGGGGRYGGRW